MPSFLTALLAARVEPVRLDLIARGVPKGQRRAILVPLRRQVARDAEELALAATALRALAKPASMGPLPPRRAILGVYFRGVPVRVAVAGAVSGESARRTITATRRGFDLDPRSLGRPRTQIDLLLMRQRPAWAQPLAMVMQ